jgi:hypothetical protein
MPLEDIKPDTFQQAACKAQQRCVALNGDLAQVSRAIRRAKELIKSAPWIVEAVMERSRDRLSAEGKL